MKVQLRKEGSFQTASNSETSEFNELWPSNTDYYYFFLWILFLGRTFRTSHLLQP
jgi:hypothetical protein